MVPAELRQGVRGLIDDHVDLTGNHILQGSAGATIGHEWASVRVDRPDACSAGRNCKTAM
jgi:hypothetical protein